PSSTLFPYTTLFRSDIDHPVISIIHVFECLYNCHFGIPFGSKSITVFTELAIKHFRKNLCYCLLYDSVDNRWYAQKTFPTVRFRYFDPKHWLWFIRSISNG